MDWWKGGAGREAAFLLPLNPLTHTRELPLAPACISSQVMALHFQSQRNEGKKDTAVGTATHPRRNENVREKTRRNGVELGEVKCHIIGSSDGRTI